MAAAPLKFVPICATAVMTHSPVISLIVECGYLYYVNNLNNCKILKQLFMCLIMLVYNYNVGTTKTEIVVTGSLTGVR